jgi:hypothetical protein
MKNEELRMKNANKRKQAPEFVRGPEEKAKKSR